MEATKGFRTVRKETSRTMLYHLHSELGNNCESNCGKHVIDAYVCFVNIHVVLSTLHIKYIIIHHCKNEVSPSKISLCYLLFRNLRLSFRAQDSRLFGDEETYSYWLQPSLFRSIYMTCYLIHQNVLMANKLF